MRLEKREIRIVLVQKCYLLRMPCSPQRVVPLVECDGGRVTLAQKQAAQIAQTEGTLKRKREFYTRSIS